MTNKSILPKRKAAKCLCRCQQLSSQEFNKILSCPERVMLYFDCQFLSPVAAVIGADLALVLAYKGNGLGQTFE